MEEEKAMNNKLTASRFLPECLKPEEISGDKRESRLNELMNWFDRYYNGEANPKWFKSHAAELCYFILSESELQERRKTDSEPDGYHVIKECGKVGCSVATLEEAENTRDFWNKKWIIKPYFYAPLIQHQ